MARTNKYASLNFNDIYEKKIIGGNNNHSSSKHPHSLSSATSSSSLTSPNKTIHSNSRIHGNMLVLSRPTPKPIPIPIPTPVPPHQQHPPPQTTPPDQTRSEPDAISLRPLGRTGAGPSLIPSPLTSPPVQNKEKERDLSLSVSPKPNRFVPPHLRPGFLGREEKPAGPGGGVRSREFAGRRQGHFGSPNRYEEDGGRPKSGGGYYDRSRDMNRPGSSGIRPSSSG